MGESGETSKTSEIARGLLKDYFLSIKKLETAQTLSIVSLILSALFVSKVFGFFILNILYIVNIAFFALIVRDCWVIRKKNPLPIGVAIISIVLTSMLLIDVVKMMDLASSFTRMMGD